MRKIMVESIECKVLNILHFLAMHDFHDRGIIVIHAALTLRPAVSCVASSFHHRGQVGQVVKEKR